MENWTDRETRQRFYRSKEWRNLRDYVLTEEPFCYKCKENGKLKPSSVVDHIIDIQDAPHLRLERTNLKGMCTHCHNTKSGRGERLEMKRVWKI